MKLSPAWKLVTERVEGLTGYPACLREDVTLASYGKIEVACSGAPLRTIAINSLKGAV